MVFVAIFAGLLIGHATTVGAGVILMDEFSYQYFHRQTYNVKHAEISNFCIVISHLIQFVVSITQISAILGFFVSIFICGSVGLWPSLFAAPALCITGAVVTIFAPAAFTIYIGRILTGIGIGFAYQAFPSMISMVRPSTKVVFDYSILFGIFWAYIVNYIVAFRPFWGWKISIGMTGVLGLLLLLLLVHREFTKLRMRFGFGELWISLAQLTREENLPRLKFFFLGKVLATLTGVDSVRFFAPLLLLSIGVQSFEEFLAPLLIAGVVAVASLLGWPIFSFLEHHRKRIFTLTCVCLSISLVGLGLVFIFDAPETGFLVRPSGRVTLILVIFLATAYGSLLSAEGPLTAQLPGATDFGTSMISALWDLVLSVVIGHVSYLLPCLFKGTLFFIYGITVLLFTFVGLRCWYE